MSVGALSENPYAYMDRLHEGGATIHYGPAEGSSTPKAATTADAKAPTKDGEEFSMFGEDGFGFDDFLDIINPLQHIPIISTLYREITGDELSAGARMIGGGIFGGGIGLAASIVNSAIEAQTGKDMGEHVVAMFSDDDITTDPVQVAKAVEPAATAQPQPAANTAAVSSAPAAPQIPVILPAALNKAPQEKPASIEPAALKAADSKMAASPTLAMGLEWKNSPAANVHKTIEKIRDQQGDNLTSDQLARIISSFNQAAPAAAVEPKRPQNTEKLDFVSEITPANRSQALQSYDRGADIAALSQKSYYNFGNEATR